MKPQKFVGNVKDLEKLLRRTIFKVRVHLFVVYLSQFSVTWKSLVCLARRT